MALTYIWFFMLLVGFLVAAYKAIFLGDYEIFSNITKGMFETAEDSVMKIALPLVGTMTFFTGLLKIAEKAGAINFLAKLIAPFFSTLFPEVPKNHPANGHMVMNFSANILGLDNAATPFGLKAMESLQELNPKKDTASNAQIMFMVLHASGLTLIPISIMAYRSSNGALNPTDVFVPCILGTAITTLAAIAVVSFKQKLKFRLNFILALLYIITALAFFCIMVYYMPTETKNNFTKLFGNVLLALIILAIICGGLIKKVNLFDAFIEGAKSGFETIIKIIPYLVGILVAIKVFRVSGAFEYLIMGLSYLFTQIGIDTEFVKALPTALMKPISGSGARGLMLESYKTYGVDSFPGFLSSIFNGSADTTVYIAALYFGSVSIKKIRYSIWASLIADLVGVICAIFIAYLFYTGKK
jgi:spore maturation protein SpmA